MRRSKIVYVLGAGASKTVGLPLQGELLRCIFDLRPKEIDKQISFLQLEFNLEEQKLLGIYEEFNKQRIKLADFIISNFAAMSLKAEYYAEYLSLADRKQEDNGSKLTLFDLQYRAFQIASRVNVTLEDLFTLFDKVIIGREHFRVYSPFSIQEIHTALRKCIIFTLAYSSFCIKEINTLKYFAEKLVEYKMNSIASADNLSIITMNWDAYFEKCLFQACEKNNSYQARRKIYPDLCFYDYCYDPNENRIVSTHIKAKGYRNIKVLKLHGSMNWLVCSYCGRVFVDYKKDIATDEMLTNCYCPQCYKDFQENINSPQLHSMLITPTYLKDLNDLNIKNIWHNALIELTEADKVVFIGYSFPDADFEMRCLLKKALKPNIEIDVVLHELDSPDYYQTLLASQINKEQIISKLSLPETRYISFFGKDMLKFYYSGMETYLENHFPREAIE